MLYMFMKKNHKNNYKCTLIVPYEEFDCTCAAISLNKVWTSLDTPKVNIKNSINANCVNLS
jgi:hypothetical protein